MKNRVKHMLLIGDSPEINFYNKKIIEKTGLTDKISIVRNSRDALSYFDTNKNNKTQPEIIFLDFYGLVKDGWEFLHHYDQLHVKNAHIILLLEEDLLPDGQKKIKNYPFIKAGSEKILNRFFIQEFVDKHFSN